MLKLIRKSEAWRALERLQGKQNDDEKKKHENEKEGK